MQALSLVGFEGWFLSEALPAFRTGLNYLSMEGRRASRSTSWLSKGSQWGRSGGGAGAVLGGILVLDQRGHGGSGMDINVISYSSHNEVSG
jgi:hypothetical protein